MDVLIWTTDDDGQRADTDEGTYSIRRVAGGYMVGYPMPPHGHTADGGVHLSVEEAKDEAEHWHRRFIELG